MSRLLKVEKLLQIETRDMTKRLNRRGKTTIKKIGTLKMNMGGS